MSEIKSFLQEWDRIFEEYRSEKKQSLKRPLRIGSIRETGQYIYLKHLIEFQKHYPETRILLNYEGSEALEKKVIDGDLDFALVSRFTPRKYLDSLLLFKDRPVLVGHASKDFFEKSQKDLFLIQYREEDFYTSDFLKRNISAHLRKKIQVIACVGSHESMLQWSFEQKAFCVVPRSSFEQSIYKNRLKVFKEDEIQTEIHLIYLANSQIEMSKRRFLERALKMSKLFETT